ncbi:hypothetical protein CTI12_AA445240 [Artemisia annua]|uniref:PPM-type phosphatase domain-containing protein n=1 Tax=Artemisia annua TaxID=35608 RepID=A0A2U1LWI5_ARTAN|nr:hypothetical protein CTI12_AA445240 [Artemisia annua]
MGDDQNCLAKTTGGYRQLLRIENRALPSVLTIVHCLPKNMRPSCLQEKKRVEELGGYFEDGYLNGELAVTRALGDRHMKSPIGSNSKSPLIAEPEMTQWVLSDDDEFMIIGCDGIWDVMSNKEAVDLVRRQLMHHNDPKRCARELIDQALRLHTSDNLTAIVVCFSSQIKPPQPWRPKFRRSGL